MLLALSVLVSLFGIVNTLVLSIYERTHELGMMRAIGTSRRQIRQMIRYESLITALIGGVLGLVIGVVGAILVTTLALSGSGYVLSIPVGTLVLLLIAAAFAGVLAAQLPARRAARLDILARWPASRPGVRRSTRAPSIGDRCFADARRSHRSSHMPIGLRGESINRPTAQQGGCR